MQDITVKQSPVPVQACLRGRFLGLLLAPHGGGSVRFYNHGQEIFAAIDGPLSASLAELLSALDDGFICNEILSVEMPEPEITGTISRSNHVRTDLIGR